MLSKLDKKIISLISKDVPLVERPFEGLASEMGIKENELLDKLKAYKKAGLMRKFSGVINHRKIGFKYNAMVVWNVPEVSSRKTGRIMASFDEVSHCYQRPRRAGWVYNLYTMIHGRTKKDCLKVVEAVSRETGFDDYKILFSSKEFKKTGVKY